VDIGAEECAVKKHGPFSAELVVAGRRRKLLRGASTGLAARVLGHDDLFVVVLKGHYELERLLNEVLLSGRESRQGHLEAMDLRWSQKLELAIYLGRVSGSLGPAMRKLNSIRNDLAHGLEAELTPKHEHELWTAFPLALRQELVKAWNEIDEAPFDEGKPGSRLKLATAGLAMALAGVLDESGIH